MKNTLVINLFGGPGTGKSVFASDLFSLLKKNHFDAELVQEFPKQLIRKGLFEALKHQFYIFANQDFSVKYNIGKTDVVVTDSPVLLSPVYASPNYPIEALEICCKYAHDQDNSLNIFLDRNTERPFQKEGRVHTEEESKIKDIEIHNFLEKMNVDHIHVQTNNEGLQTVLDIAKTRLNQN